MVITLIGYRACGKSTVGEHLAERLGWRFVDSDRLIEDRARKSIAAIFAEDGEPRFREIEREVIGERLTDRSIILSAGGGAILDASTRQRMRDAGPVVWLRASVEAIVSRLTSDAGTAENRPSLTGKSVTDEVSEVLAFREPLYRETASMTVDTDNRDIASIVDGIITQLASERNRSC